MFYVRQVDYVTVADRFVMLLSQGENDDHDLHEPPPPMLTLRGGGFLPSEPKSFRTWRVCLPCSIE
jgi:hypothetical protein